MDFDFLKNNENFKNISPEKINFLMQFAAQNKSGNAKEMSNMILGAMNNAKKEGIQFTPNETDMIIEILKQNMSPEEQRKADQILLLMKNMRRWKTKRTNQENLLFPSKLLRQKKTAKMGGNLVYGRFPPSQSIIPMIPKYRLYNTSICVYAWNLL